MLDQAHKYVFVLKPPLGTVKDDRDGFILLMFLEKFVNGALLQIKRVERTKRSTIARLNRGQRKFPTAAMEQLFMDAHFYFICIGQVNKFLKQLARCLDNPKLKKLRSEFEQDFRQEIRNHLEHLDERVVGRHVKGGKLVDAAPEIVSAWKQDFVNFRGDKLSFGGKQYAVNAEAAKRLRGFHMRVIAVIREDYALKDRRFVADEMREKDLRKIMGWSQKFYGQQKPGTGTPSQSKT